MPFWETNIFLNGTDEPKFLHELGYGKQLIVSGFTRENTIQRRHFPKELTLLCYEYFDRYSYNNIVRMFTDGLKCNEAVGQRLWENQSTSMLYCQNARIGVYSTNSRQWCSCITMINKDMYDTFIKFAVIKDDSNQFSGEYIDVKFPSILLTSNERAVMARNEQRLREKQKK
mmetsp:Transcript_71754/g.87979  ORF Transcript_71754/g.87979 Transcript_71754/m.87979 type:complete len:172 (+) Transcript_71754:978-1493(+)